MAYPQVDEMSAATYLSQFVNAKYKDPSNTLETEVNASDPKILRYGNEEEEEEKDEDDGDEGKKRKGKSSKRKNDNLEVGSKKKKAKLEKFEDEDDDNNVYDSSVKSESLQVQTQPINKRKRSSIKVEKDATTWWKQNNTDTWRVQYNYPVLLTFKLLIKFLSHQEPIDLQ